MLHIHYFLWNSQTSANTFLLVLIIKIFWCLSEKVLGSCFVLITWLLINFEDWCYFILFKVHWSKITFLIFHLLCAFTLICHLWVSECLVTAWEWRYLGKWIALSWQPMSLLSTHKVWLFFVDVHYSTHVYLVVKYHSTWFTFDC